jgi:hypothetical protein
MAKENPMRILFVGGPGRNGTSFVADRLGAHEQVVTLKDIELKIFCEKDGLQDLFHALVSSYSPNCAVMVLDQFTRMTQALVEGSYGQPAFSTAAPATDWQACFQTFTSSLLEDGHPTPQSPDSFFKAARTLLNQIATISGDDIHITKHQQSHVFLEKTPHNLLAIDFLHRLAPGAQYLHVMCDPRSIAWSLLAMRWGPDKLTTAAAWVDSYCRAWTVAEGHAAQLGLPLIRLHIEEAAADPTEAAAWLTAQLGLASHDGLFKGANPELLNRWATKANPAERALLDDRLGGWVTHFGYEPDHIGRRSTMTRPAPAEPRPEITPASGQTCTESPEPVAP